MPSGEIKVPLAANFADDPKLRKLAKFGRESRFARDLYVQMLCYCKANMSDGHVPDEQIGLLVYPDSEKNGHRDAARLAEVKVLERVGDGYLVKAYLKRNKSRAEVQKEALERTIEAELGNHERWHVRRGVTNSDCRLCHHDTTREGESSPESGPDRLPDRGGESSKSLSKSESKASDRQGDHDAGLDLFDDFYSAYPRHTAKGAARKAWASMLKRGADPQRVITVAASYASRVAGSDPKFIPHPATWLNQERYDDEATAAAQPQGEPPPNWMEQRKMPGPLRYDA